MEFNKYRLSDIADVQTGPFGSQLHKEDYVESGIPIITVEHLGENKIIHSNLPKVNKEDWERLSKYVLKKNDIVFSRVGSVDRCALVSPDEENWLFSGRCLRVRVKNLDVIDPKYLSYYFATKKFKRYIRSIAVGATMPSINTKILSEIQIEIPDIDSQREIAELFYSLDSKKWVNESIIKNLEHVSSALFKHWFIDFEFPNEEGKPYKSNGGDMIESELGDIPATWSIVKLSDITKILKKTFNPKKTDVENVIHFSLPAYDKNQLPTLDNVSTIKSNKWLLEDNCVVFSKMNPRTPRVWLPNLKNHLLNVASSEFVVLKNNSRESNSFMYNLCKSEAFNEYLIAHATGSTNSRQRVTPAVALDFKMALCCKMMESYGETVMGMSETIKSLHEENAYLQQIRDSLLPKLLSGEMKIPNELEV